MNPPCYIARGLQRIDSERGLRYTLEQDLDTSTPRHNLDTNPLVSGPDFDLIYVYDLDLGPIPPRVFRQQIDLVETDQHLRRCRREQYRFTFNVYKSLPGFVTATVKSNTLYAVPRAFFLSLISLVVASFAFHRSELADVVS